MGSDRNDGNDVDRNEKLDRLDDYTVNLTIPVTELFRIVVQSPNSLNLLKHHAPCALGLLRPRTPTRTVRMEISSIPRGSTGRVVS